MIRAKIISTIRINKEYHHFIEEDMGSLMEKNEFDRSRDNWAVEKTKSTYLI